MFLKQYNFKPRSNSQSSGTSDSAPANQQSTPTDTSTPLSQGQRRSSAADKFSGLQSMKRTSLDTGSDAKKASFLEQKPGNPGILGGMWHSFTKGT